MGSNYNAGWDHYVQFSTKPFALNHGRLIGCDVIDGAVYIWGDIVKVARVRFGELLLIIMLEKGHQRIVETVGVQEQNRLGMGLKLFEREHFDNFFQRAETSRQSNKSISAAFHFGLP